MAEDKKMKAKIHRIQDGNGRWLTTQEEMMAAGILFYHDQFASSSDCVDFHLVSQLIPSMITEEMNNS